MAATLLAYTALAAVPSSVPIITNGTLVKGVQIANASVTRANGQPKKRVIW